MHSRYTAPAASSGVPPRPSGIICTINASRSGFYADPDVPSVDADRGITAGLLDLVHGLQSRFGIQVVDHDRGARGLCPSRYRAACPHVESPYTNPA
jgi:hypothetical protein